MSNIGQTAISAVRPDRKQIFGHLHLTKQYLMSTYQIMSNIGQTAISAVKPHRK